VSKIIKTGNKKTLKIVVLLLFLSMRFLSADTMVNEVLIDDALVREFLNNSEIILNNENEEKVTSPKLKADATCPKNSTWSEIQKKSKDAVIQIFSYMDEFNWTEPYKTPNQYPARGTGFFINEQGYLLTNFHVVHQARVVYVQVPSLGKERFEAEIVGFSADKDVAVLKLKESDLQKLLGDLKDVLGYSSIPFLTLGESDDLVGAQEIMILGYPLGQENLKSSIGNIAGPQDLGGRTLIQTTAPVNPGNSGGPFVNKDGQVVGIEVSGIPGAQNVGYFIPISEVKHLILGLVEGLYDSPILRSPFWGGELRFTTVDTLEFLGNPTDGGVYVAQVIKGSLFEKSGIKKGDVIYSANEVKVDKFGYVNVDWCEDKVRIYDMLDRFRVGDQVNLVVYRKGEKLNISFNVEIEDVLPVRQIYPGFEEIDYEVIGGMVVMELRHNHLEIVKAILKENVRKFDALILPAALKYGKDKNRHKSRLGITHLHSGSQVGNTRCFAQGDILKKINEQAVETLDDFRDAVKKSKKTGYLTVETEDGSYAAIPVEKILEEEDMLSNYYFFPKSEVLKEIV